MDLNPFFLHFLTFIPHYQVSFLKRKLDQQTRLEHNKTNGVNVRFIKLYMLMADERYCDRQRKKVIFELGSMVEYHVGNDSFYS